MCCTLNSDSRIAQQSLRPNARGSTGQDAGRTSPGRDVCPQRAVGAIGSASRARVEDDGDVARAGATSRPLREEGDPRGQRAGLKKPSLLLSSSAAETSRRAIRGKSSASMRKDGPETLTAATTSPSAPRTGAATALSPT